MDGPELLWAARNSFSQATYSAVITLLLGSFLAFGLHDLDRMNARLGEAARVILLAPSLLPPFFVLLTVMSWVDPFPLGLPGIVIAHVFQYSGFVAVSLATVFSDRLAALAEAAACMGSNRRQFLRAGFPLIRRELALHWSFIFIICFTSFSIPLVVGGAKGTTLEILIYEKIRISNDISAATQIAMLQFVAMGLLLWVLPQDFNVRRRAGRPTPLLSSRSGAVIIFGLSIFTLAPWFFFLKGGMGQLSRVPELGELLLTSLSGSLFYTFFSAWLFLILLLALSYWSGERIKRMLRIYFPPSMALVGVLGVMLAHSLGADIAYLLAVSFMFFPILYRFGFDRVLSSLEDQQRIAEVLGASRAEIWWRIVIPQIWPQLMFIVSLGAVWVFGDFALASFLLPGQATLPLVIESLMTSYRVHAAMAVGALVLLMSGVILFLGRRLSHVFD